MAAIRTFQFSEPEEVSAGGFNDITLDPDEYEAEQEAGGVADGAPENVSDTKDPGGDTHTDESAAAPPEPETAAEDSGHAQEEKAGTGPGPSGVIPAAVVQCKPRFQYPIAARSVDRTDSFNEHIEFHYGLHSGSSIASA